MKRVDYRSGNVDYLGLSTETKPTGGNLIDGATYYEVDTSKFYIYYKEQWYEQG